MGWKTQQCQDVIALYHMLCLLITGFSIRAIHFQTIFSPFMLCYEVFLKCFILFYCGIETINRNLISCLHIK